MAHPFWPFPKGSVVVGRSKRGREQFVPAEMRSMHAQLIGATGTGKSKALELMVRQDLLALDDVRRGMFVVDPHGAVIESVLKWHASHGLQRYRTIRLLDPAVPFAFNPLRARPGIDPAVIAAAFKNAVAKVSGGMEANAMPQYSETLMAVGYAAVELGLTLVDAIELLAINDHSGLRGYAIEQVTSPTVRQFFMDLEALPPARRDEKVGSAKRRLSQFVLPAAVRRIFSQKDDSLDVRQLMDDGEIVFVNLAHAEGKISEDEATLLGTLLINDLFLSCLGRPEGAIPCYLYLDECHRYLTTDVANILNESRKFGLHAVLAHQHLGQLRTAGEHVYRSVMTNTRTKLVFGGLDPEDAEEMTRTIFRGQFDLQKPKERYTKPFVVGQELEWLLSQSASVGVSNSVGHNSSVGGSVARSRSVTESESETDSESTTIGESETESESVTTSEGSSSSRSSTRDSKGEDISNTSQDGTSGGTARTTGTSQTTSTAHTTGHARTTGIAHTRGATHGRNWQEGRSTSTGMNVGFSLGRSQAYRSIYKDLPTVSYSLEELVHLAAVEIANLPQGHAILKIGTRPAMPIKVLYVAPGWARAEHVEYTKRLFASVTPFIVSTEEAEQRYLFSRRELEARVRPPERPDGDGDTWG